MAWAELAAERQRVLAEAQGALGVRSGSSARCQTWQTCQQPSMEESRVSKLRYRGFGTLGTFDIWPEVETQRARKLRRRCLAHP
jgi:hypothetical protein